MRVRYFWEALLNTDIEQMRQVMPVRRSTS